MPTAAKSIATVQRLERQNNHTHVTLTADVAEGPLEIVVRVYTPENVEFAIGRRFIVTLERTDLTSLKDA